MATTNGQRERWRSPFDLQDALDFAEANELMPWSEVTEAWNAQSGESITRPRVIQIARAAEKKLARQLSDLEGCETLL